jgi:hypothetical protein
MFWVTALTTPCRFVGNYESLTGTYCIHLHGRAERRKDFSETLATPATRGHGKVTYVHHLRRHNSLLDVIIFFSSTFRNETFFSYSLQLKNVCFKSVSQSVQRLPTAWTIRDLNSGWGEVYHTHPDRPWAPLSFIYNGYRVIPGSKAAGTWR